MEGLKDLNCGVLVISGLCFVFEMTLGCLEQIFKIYDLYCEV